MRAWNSTLRAGGPLRTYKPMKATAWKKRAPKKRAGRHDKSMLDACRGQPCFLAIDWVCLGPAGFDTVVPCHSNQARHGKATGRKADDIYTVPGCMACHRFIDQSGAPKELKFSLWDAAYARWAPIRDGGVA